MGVFIGVGVGVVFFYLSLLLFCLFWFGCVSGLLFGYAFICVLFGFLFGFILFVGAGFVGAGFVGYLFLF